MQILRRIFFYTIISSIALITSCKKDTVFKTYAKQETTIIPGDSRLLNDTLHFFKDTVYILGANINRLKGQVFLIDAGTLVKVNDGISITINAGARIEAIGTATEPIVFTSFAYKGLPGYIGTNDKDEHSWLGIAIYGNYPNTLIGDNSVFGTGILKYVRIEFAGRKRHNSSSLPSLLLKNVGKGTVINNIQVSYSVAYSSFQISGGNVNAGNLVSYASGNIDYNLLDGYKGLLQNLLAYRHPYFSPQPGSGTTLAGLQISGDETNPSISNLTVLGPDLQFGTNPKYSDTIQDPFGSKVAAFIATGGKFHIRNSVLMGFPEGAVYIDSKYTAQSLENGSSDIKYTLFHSNDAYRTFYLTPKIYKQYNSQDLKGLLLRPGYNGHVIDSSAAFMFTGPFNFDVHPDPMPKAGSPVLSGADFNDPVYEDTFFNKVTYRGALGTDNWLQSWTNFIPLQTNYNN